VRGAGVGGVPGRSAVEVVAHGGIEQRGVDGTQSARDAEPRAERVHGSRRHATTPQRRQRVQPRVIPVCATPEIPLGPTIGLVLIDQQTVGKRREEVRSLMAHRSMRSAYERGS
jgi:hypothetical protein